jgi:TonB family protein
MSVAAIGMDGMFSEDTGRLPRFLVPSLMAHGALIALLLGFSAFLYVPVERPMKVQIMAAPAPGPSPSAAEAPAGPAIPGAQAGRAQPPELIEMPKPKVEEAPRSKRFAGVYDRQGGPGAKASPRDAEAWTKNAPKVEGGKLRGEESVRALAVPPAESGPPVTLPAASNQSSPTQVAPLPQGRTALVQPAAPAATAGAPGATSAPAARPARPSLRDQVASLGLTYRPPVDDPGVPNDPSGRGESGLDTFRFKYATWGLAVKRDLERAWKVPAYGISSLAVVRFVVLPDGRVRNLELEKSSGLASLDQAATSAVTDAAPFRPFPERMREENPGGVEILVNFYYREGRGVLQWE